MLGVVALSGCSSLNMGPEGSRFGDYRVNPAGANQMFDRGFEGFNDEQLILLLDPDELQKDNGKYYYNNDKEFSDLNPTQKQKVLRQAFRNANKYTDAKAHRAQIQDRLFAA